MKGKKIGALLIVSGIAYLLGYWIGDTSDGKHMILRISDEETEDYKEFQETLKELEEYDE